MAWTPFTRSEHDRTSPRYTSDMSDREFAVIAPHLPGQPKRERKRRVCLRSVISGVFYVLQNCCAWANLPKDFPPRSTVYGYFRRFIEDGTWARIHDALYVDCRDLEGREPQPSAAIIDSQSAKTGTSATDHVGYDAGKRSRVENAISWLTRWDCCCVATSTRQAYRTGTVPAACSAGLTMRFPFLQVIFADSAYAGDKVEQDAPRPVEIVRRSAAAKGFEVLPKRWIVERTLAWITEKQAHGQGLRTLRTNRKGFHTDRHDQANDPKARKVR